MSTDLTIMSARLTLVALGIESLRAILDDDRVDAPFTWPEWWPDEIDRHHVEVWRQRATSGRSEWGPHAVVDPSRQTMIGHAGFHRPPQPQVAALSDPTFDGAATAAVGGVVEIGYTIFPAERRRGFASEVVGALVGWAFGTGDVSTVIASVAQTNAASHSVLQRAGFRVIGNCRDHDGAVEVVYRRDRD